MAVVLPLSHSVSGFQADPQRHSWQPFQSLPLSLAAVKSVRLFFLLPGIVCADWQGWLFQEYFLAALQLPGFQPFCHLEAQRLKAFSSSCLHWSQPTHWDFSLIPKNNSSELYSSWCFHSYNEWTGNLSPPKLFHTILWIIRLWLPQSQQLFSWILGILFPICQLNW